MLRHPALIPPIRRERHRPDRPESKPPHAVGAHFGRHPGPVRVAQTHAVHGTRTPPAAQIAGVHVLRDQLVTPGQERIPRIPLLHGISERLFDLVPGEGIGVGSGRRAFLEGPIALTTSGACGLEFLGDEFVERVDGDVCVTVSLCFPSFSCGIRVSIRLCGRVWSGCLPYRFSVFVRMAVMPSAKCPMIHSADGALISSSPRFDGPAARCACAAVRSCGRSMRGRRRRRCRTCGSIGRG